MAASARSKFIGLSRWSISSSGENCDLACHLKLKLGHPSYCNRLRLGSERYISRRVS